MAAPNTSSSDLASYVEALENRVATAHRYFLEYQALYASSDEVSSLLQRTAPDFFAMVRNALVISVMTILRGLDDPAESNVKGVRTMNVSFRGLPQRLRADGQLEAADEVDALIVALQEKMPAVSALVNKRIAHLDWEHSIGGQAHLNMGIDVEVAESLLYAATCVLDGATGKHTQYAGFVKGAGELVYLLRQWERGVYV